MRWSSSLHLLSSLVYGSVTCVCDCCFPGSSDPYVKFKLAGKEVFRSKTIHKNLNPVWDQKITLIVDSLSEPLYVKVRTTTGVSVVAGGCWSQQVCAVPQVFDYDFGLQDDFMGSAYLHLESLEQQRYVGRVSWSFKLKKNICANWFIIKVIILSFPC